MKNWVKSANGNLLAYPITGWDRQTTATLGVLQLRYAQTDEDLEAGGIPFQIHMTPHQLRALSQDLAQMADHIEGGPSGTKQ